MKTTATFLTNYLVLMGWELGRVRNTTGYGGITPGAVCMRRSSESAIIYPESYPVRFKNRTRLAYKASIAAPGWFQSTSATPSNNMQLRALVKHAKKWAERGDP